MERDFTTKRFVNVRISWVKPEDGGREKPVESGTRYCLLIYFEGTTDNETAWSADIQIENTDENLCNEAVLTFLADDTPFSLLYSDHRFELYEGPKLVAYGEVR